MDAVTRQMKMDARQNLREAGHNRLTWLYVEAVRIAQGKSYGEDPARWAAAWAVAGMVKARIRLNLRGCRSFA